MQAKSVRFQIPGSRREGSRLRFPNFDGNSFRRTPSSVPLKLVTPCGKLKLGGARNLILTVYYSHHLRCAAKFYTVLTNRSRMSFASLRYKTTDLQNSARSFSRQV